MSKFNSLLSTVLEEGRKAKTEVFAGKNFNLSKIENSLEKAKEGFMALANIKWLGSLKPEKVEQVFDAVINQLGKDDNVSYESVKKSIAFALSRTLPATNAKKWERQFRNWIENLQDIQVTSSASTEDTADTTEPEETQSEQPSVEDSPEEDTTESPEPQFQKEEDKIEKDVYNFLLDGDERIEEINKYLSRSEIKSAINKADQGNTILQPVDKERISLEVLQKRQPLISKALEALKSKGKVEEKEDGLFSAVVVEQEPGEGTGEFSTLGDQDEVSDFADDNINDYIDTTDLSRDYDFNYESKELDNMMQFFVENLKKH